MKEHVKFKKTLFHENSRWQIQGEGECEFLKNGKNGENCLSRPKKLLNLENYRSSPQNGEFQKNFRRMKKKKEKKISPLKIFCSFSSPSSSKMVLWIHH